MVFQSKLSTFSCDIAYSDSPATPRGFRSLDEVADADNLAVSDGGDDRKPKLGGRTAPLPDPRDAGVRDDDIAGLREVLRLRVELIELSAQRVEELTDARMASIELAADELARRHPLDLGVERPEKGVPVASTERLEGVAYDLHVLLRHRSRSISLWP
jgi:hypothetical protein